MTEYGVTPQGFVGKDLTTIKTELESSFKSVFGNDIDLSPESVDGQIIGNLSIKFTNIWELLAALYASFNPDSATGISQDGGAALVNVKRINWTKSEVWVMLYGDLNSVILKDHQIRQGNGTIFKLYSDTTITNTIAGDVQIIISNDPVVDQVYSVTINSTVFSYTALTGDTKADILQAVADLIIAGNVPVICEILTDTLRVTTENGYTPFNITTTANMEFSVLSTPGRYIADIAGAIAVPTNTVNNIVQLVSGLDSVNNIIPGTAGLNRESNDAFRIRRRVSLFSHGFATDEAIRARVLQEVVGVSFCKVISNRENEEDLDGRSPHSTEVIVMGGDNTAIANKLWEVFPGGITFFGNVSVTIQDSMGDNQIIRFSRPVLKYIWVKVTITLNTEETFPVTGGDTIKENIINWSLSNISVGTDVIWQKLLAPVYDGVDGIADALIELGVTDTAETPPVTYSTQNISITSIQLAYFVTSQIEVFTL